jgi:hypothetical protein
VVELFVNPECLGQGVEIFVAILGAGKTSTDHQWSFVCGHPQLEVSVMRYRHELGERWSTEDGVVLRGPIDYLEFDLLFFEVRGRAENYVQVNHPQGYVGFPGTIPWKEVYVGKRSFIGILISGSVSA